MRHTTSRTCTARFVAAIEPADRVLSDAAREAGVRVRLSTTVADLDDLGDTVAVRLTDGTQARYDLVVALTASTPASPG